jgi:CLIP-associating protein 1/2
MIKHTTAYRVLLAHIVATAQEKNVQTRQFGATHLKVFLDNIAKHLPVIESTHGAIDQVQSTIKKLLSDVNPQVREQARAAFWGFDKLWPKKSAALMESLDSTARKQLEKASGSGLASAPATPVRAAPPKARASAAILAAKRARAAELAAERAAAEQNNQAPSDPAPDSALDNTPEPVTPAGLARLRREPVEPMSPSPALPRALGLNVEALVPSTPPALVASPVGDSETAVHAAQTPSPAKNIASPARSIPRPVASSRTSTDPSALRRVSGGSLPRPIVPPASGAVKSIPSSNTSSRSRSPSLSRTLSRSPPSLMESMHQPFRTPGSVGPSAASSDTSKLRTPVQQRFSASKSSRGQELLVTTSPADSHQMASPPAAHTNYFSEPPLDAADEARRAQVAQGLSAAQQLIDFDDDLPTTSQQPITPARPSRLAQNTPLNRFQTPRNASGNRVRQVWEDSPRALTPKVLKRIEGRNTERNWWAQRRDSK